MFNFTKLHCSFCGKSEAEVAKLVAGPRVYICDSCVAIASSIMNDSQGQNQPERVELTVCRKVIDRVRRLFRVIVANPVTESD